eukprot:TRINITY_DN26111_c0_g2_i2.p1 TRINITY_DN26111_c0_g2~~TRINITY_DN26111_c0_g2_i2.p1  ORF type:complete len:118 (-),score=4.34 TRINITY_DN26111_c0_g2_i2:24-377(-)
MPWHVQAMKDDSLELLNKSVQYVINNEITNELYIIHIFKDVEDGTCASLERNVKVLDEMYPKIKISLVLAKGEFTPTLVANLAQEIKVPPNLMFISCPGDRFPHSISSFGGVRVITH